MATTKPPMQNDKDGCTRFGCWIRDNTSVVIMFALVLVFLSFALHIAHADDVDTETLRWARDKLGEVLIALVALLQGAKSLSKSNYLPTGDDNSVTVVTPLAAPLDDPTPAK